MRRLRRPRRAVVLYWAVVVLLASGTARVIDAAAADARALAARHGEARRVPVALRHVPAGRVLTPSDVAVRPVPAAFLPAAPAARRAVGSATLVALVPGEVVLAARLAPEGLRGPAALVPPGSRAVAVPDGPAGRPPLAVGDRVDVLATVPDDDEPTFPVALDAVVVGVTDDAVTVAVPLDDVARVAFAVTTGAVTLALRGGG